jgi:hypothetical protein
MRFKRYCSVVVNAWMRCHPSLHDGPCSNPSSHDAMHFCTQYQSFRCVLLRVCAFRYSQPLGTAAAVALSNLLACELGCESQSLGSPHLQPRHWHALSSSLAIKNSLFQGYDYLLAMPVKDLMSLRLYECHQLIDQVCAACARAGLPKRFVVIWH